VLPNCAGELRGGSKHGYGKRDGGGEGEGKSESELQIRGRKSLSLSASKKAGTTMVNAVGKHRSNHDEVGKQAECRSLLPSRWYDGSLHVMPM
jgi:hypothetical protein